MEKDHFSIGFSKSFLIYGCSYTSYRFTIIKSNDLSELTVASSTVVRIAGIFSLNNFALFNH